MSRSKTQTMHALDANGWPVILAKPAALAQAPAPRPLLDGRKILTARQCADVMGLDLDTTVAVLGRQSVGRIVGWDSEAVVNLSDRLRTDAGLRRELGLKPTHDRA